MKKIPVPPPPENTLILVWAREPGDGWIGSVLGETLYKLWYDQEGTGRWQLGYRTAVKPPQWGSIQSQWCNREWSRAGPSGN